MDPEKILLVKIWTGQNPKSDVWNVICPIAVLESQNCVFE